MENPIIISNLNDFIFCPISIYCHMLYDGIEKMLYQSSYQLDGTQAHKSIDRGSYSGASSIVGIDVYCEEYNLVGKIDLYNEKTKELTERKKSIKKIYDGYIFQLYAQYFSMVEMGYDVKKLSLYSMDDNKKYPVDLPENSPEMFEKFKNVLNDMKEFSFNNFTQTNLGKCKKCIYEPYCDRGKS